MKQCPVCKAVYADDSLSFCLSDGTVLHSIPDEEETRVISPGRNRININAQPAETLPAFTPPIVSHQPPTQNMNSRLVAVLVGLLAIVILIFAGFVAFTFLRNDDSKIAESDKTSPTVSPTTNDETNKLKEKVANLEKKIEDQRNQKTATPVPTSTTQRQTGKAARINSPRDGFLALRSEPSAETGYRIAEMPHGSSVNLISCQDFSSAVGSKRGRWCQVVYDGMQGWAFDAFLVY